MNAVLGRIASTAQELAHYHSGDGIILVVLSLFMTSFYSTTLRFSQLFKLVSFEAYILILLIFLY